MNKEYLKLIENFVNDEFPGLKKSLRLSNIYSNFIGIN